jgi:hypothetical protein
VSVSSWPAATVEKSPATSRIEFLHPSNASWSRQLGALGMTDSRVVPLGVSKPCEVEGTLYAAGFDIQCRRAALRECDWSHREAFQSHLVALAGQTSLWSGPGPIEWRRAGNHGLLSHTPTSEIQRSQDFDTKIEVALTTGQSQIIGHPPPPIPPSIYFPTTRILPGGRYRACVFQDTETRRDGRAKHFSKRTSCASSRSSRLGLCMTFA